uniref:Uncharacterized protein n=1 Tax=Oryza punctata TaxID=4537 RepID=A0A0E0JE92_ORYPU
MAEEAWRERFRQRVVEAGDLIRAALQLLTEARGHLEAQMLVGDAAAVRARIQLAQGVLGSASCKLALATSLVIGAKLLALRGGSYNPLMPYDEINHLGDEYVAEMNAWARLREAGRAAEEACASIDRCNGHLETTSLLLDHGDLPGVNGFIEKERLDATTGDLEAAIGRVELGSERAFGARQDVSGAN